MRFLSLFSGIEAASVAWEPFGWSAAAFAEIDPFCCALLAQRFPQIPNLGDVEKATFDETGSIDICVFGSPCQSFSIAGNRSGLDDARGNLALIALEVVDRVRPRWFLFENVPGLLSSRRGRDFATFLGAVRERGYMCAWRVLDAQYFGIPQRRRRVFVVGYLGDWRPPAAVLFEPESVRGHSAPSRAAEEDIAGALGEGPVGSHGDTSYCLNGGGMNRQDYETETLIVQNRKVRKLTPRDCERLQGLPDDWTAIQYDGKPAPDTVRCRAIGKSFPVPVMRWLGERIEAVEALQ